MRPRYIVNIQLKSFAPVGIEIGFGMGHALLDWAERSPELNLVGIELYEPGTPW